ncbi:CLUMA_CG010730, isoform A [Clunio marinus]|uniref:Mediator of RNA polymerase II transcription subunit 13 n=1 Tax=Clunio marinus TaxID=568069 RepID=A0A1J1IFV9_9DIPT|nr:CLUMA_CG010730, isoform A [Clunio marinus]
MLIQEPVQVAIWTNLNFYAYEDATFLAERLCSEIETDESLFLLATCYYRSGRTNEAYWLLSTKGAQTQKSKFLLAKCAYELKHYSEAESVLCQNKSPKTISDLDEICKEFGELSGFVMQLLSKICKQTERAAMANECCRASLKQNPFLWNSFVDLCNRGERPNPKEIFQIRNDELLSQLERQLWSNPSPEFHLYDKNVSIHEQQQQPPPTCVITPNNANIEKFEVDVEDTPLMENLNQTSLTSQPRIHEQTPYRKQFKYLQSNMIPITPSFGVLPLNSPFDSLKQTTLFLTPSPPLTTQQQTQQQQQQIIDCEKNNSNKKIRGNLNSLVTRKEIATPLQQTKPVVLNQSSNITPNRTQFMQQQQQDQRYPSVRRSSRIFSNYSVKENNKSPNLNKFVQPRSPPSKKANKRVSKSSKTTLNELNEKNNMLSEKERSETITSAQLINDMSYLQQSNHIASLKRQSADGLLQLLQELGQAYMHIQHYEMNEAVNVLESNIPTRHFNSSWVQSMIALIHHENREYEEAVKIFTVIHKREPFRLQFMEIYSTDLWHLQKDALLSMLTQDMIQHNKTSAITWCVAGNCYSALKEHDTAIKFFNRAIQVDPDFPYSYTLLGHELVVTEELEKALGCYRKAILKDPRHYNAWFGIGTIYSKQERFQLAEIHYRHALKINRKNSVILVHIGVMQFYLHKPEHAIQTLTEGIKLEPNNPLCKFHRASMNFSIGKLQEALSELEELKQIVPKESVVYYLIGKIHKQLGNIDLALMHFSWATDLDPKGANNQIKDKFDSVIRSHQQPEQSEGIPLREDFVEDDDVSDDEAAPGNDNDNNNSSGTIEESDITMTHQNHQTNGASLEDCHTNFFALADLCGIKWKKLVLNERPLSTGDPLDDPVLRSYTKCLAKDILCVWRRVSQHKNDLDQTGGLGMFDISQIGCTSVIHPPLSLTAAKELWIFWYGEEPDLTDLVSPELLKSPDSLEQGSWESGLSYECRSLLFKALHNLIERCLLSRDILRLGKWFVQPSLEKNAGKSSAHLSFSFAFFVHGESTVCASMDIREHPPVRPLTEEYLNEVIKNSQQTESCSLNDDNDKEDFNDINHNVSVQSVILAPFGLSAVLTGNKSENYEQYTEKIVNDWNNFYPMKKLDGDNSSSNMPQLVEVISGGIKMLYPSKYVLVTDILSRNKKDNCISENNKKIINSSETKSSYRCSEIDKDCIESSVLNFCDGIQKTASGVLPERAWQDSIMNPAYTNASVKSEQEKIEMQSENNIENSINAANGIEKSDPTTWNFVEPNHKSNCLCTRCKNVENHGSFSSLKTPGNSSSISGKSNFRNNSNRNRTPFHKRSSSDSSLSKSKERFSNQPSTSSKFNIRSSVKQSSGGSGSNGGNASQTQNSNNTNEVQQMSIGSDGSIQSPMHHNLSSVHSQPSSVPVNEQNILSPIPPSDVSPPSMTPSLENNIDQKPDIQSLNNFDKTTDNSQTNHQANNNDGGSIDNGNNTKIDFKSNNNSKQKLTDTNNKENICLKRPALKVQDCEDISEEDHSISQSLYDYSTWDAWMNHPIKRFKPDDLDRNRSNNKSSTKYDLYAGQTCSESSSVLPNLVQQIQNLNESGKIDDAKNNLNNNCGKDNRNVNGGNCVGGGSGGVDNDPDKNSNSENLFTSEGLQPSYADLNKIFDNSDDNSNDDHLVDNTPPGSNKSIGCHPADMEVPGGVCGNISDSLMESIDMMPSTKSDSYHNLGSPHEEPIDDWSFVFKPPKKSTIVGASKYAPLDNLLSQTLPPINLPSNCNYKPSWIKQKEQDEVRKKQQQLQADNNGSLMIKKEIINPPPLPEPPSIEIKKEVMSPMNVKMMASSPYGGVKNIKTENVGSTIINKLLTQGPTPPPNVFKSSIHSSMGSPSPANLQTNNYISPYPPMSHQDSIFRKTMVGIGMPMSSSHHSQPPPPYDVAIHSPSLNSNLNSISSNNDENKQKILSNNNNIKGNHPHHPQHHFMTQQQQQHQLQQHQQQSLNGQKTPEANSLLVNVLLYDTSLNIFRDHNFDSCTICVCNAGPKCVGNIRGLDSGLYLSLAASCHFNENLTTIVERYEHEITGMAKDPSNFKKRSLLSLLLKQRQQNKFNQHQNDDDSKQQQQNDSTMKEMKEISIANLSPIFDLLRNQCTLFHNSSNSVQRAIKHLNQEKYSPIIANKHVNILEYIDAFDIVTLALEQGRYVFERFDGYNNRQLYIPNQQQQQKNNNNQVVEKQSTSLLSQQQQQQAISVHKWPYLNAAGPKSNQDIIRVMKSMQVLLQKAFNQNGTTGLWDAPYAVRGPLTWREFHRLAGRGIGQCEPQPVPSVVVGHDKEWLCVSPYALQFWDKLLLEPYSHPRDIAYIVVSPDNHFITSRVKMFFKELSTTYEMCRLGRHQPVKEWEGILRVGKSVVKQENNNFDDDWLQSSLDSNKLNELLRLYGIAFQQSLVGFLSKIPYDKTLLNPPENCYNNHNSYKDHHHHHSHQRPSSLSSPMLPPHTPDSSMSANGSNNNNNNMSSMSHHDKGPNTPKSDQDDTKENLNNSTSTSEIMSQQLDQLANPPHIVLYIVEPFTSGTDSTSLERVACLSLLKYYSNVLSSIPESVKTNISVQIIAQESILELGRNRDINRWSDHMRNLALNVFTQSHRYLSHSNSVKSLTGFGTAANAEAFMKTKDEKNKAPVKLYTPPYILSTRNAKSENVENFGQSGIEQQCSSIMYCCYCLSEDQSMLLAVLTDERGEFLENCTINIDVPNRKRRKKTSARRIALQKLMDFILGVMSQTVKPWRLVIGRIGRIGHGELKGWSWLLSKPNLVKASKYLKDICKQCSVMYPQSVPSIWSACLVTLEPDSNFRVMPDQFTPDERFSQRSTQSPLSTPQDVSCTHILVFPTSAILQSSQATFHEQHLENALDFGEDFIIDDTDDVDEDINGIQHLFDEWNESAVGIPQASPTRDSHRGSPLTLDENKSRQSPGMTDNQTGQSRNIYSMPEAEEVGQLLQQPLALGYLVSTAPTGRMPSWFWACCPHLESVCPVFLKTALHIHSPSIHKENDDIYYKEQSSKIEHPLDSNTTADVLRYVLEGYNVLSWLAMDSNTHDRLSCLPIHVQMLMQLYHLHTALA